MKRLLPVTFTLLAVTYASTLKAQDSWYLGALYNAQEISIHGRDFNAAGVTAGYQYNQYFSVETRFAAGTSGYSSFYGTPAEQRGAYSEDIDNQAALLLKASYPVFGSVQVYGLAGYTKTKLEISGVGQYNDAAGNVTGDYPYKLKQSQSGFSYGLGVSYHISEGLYVFIDHQTLPDFEPNANYSRNWKSTTMGLNYSF